MLGSCFKLVVFLLLLSSCSPEPEERDVRVAYRVNTKSGGEKSLVLGEDPGEGLEEQDENVEVEPDQKQKIGNDGRIVGGVPARKHEFPFMVYLGGCGGSLISSQHILTAAHCVNKVNKRNLRDFTVTLGEHDLGTTSEAQSLRRGVSAIIRHSNYGETHDSDIAVVKLNEPVVFSSSIQPVGLVARGSDYTGGLVTVAGWGTRYVGGQISNVLRKVQVRVVSWRSCRDAYGLDITNTMVCASSPGKDSCQGDSGGPLFSCSSSGACLQLGIVSFGVGCASPDYPGVYADVGALRAWIDLVVAVY